MTTNRIRTIALSVSGFLVILLAVTIMVLSYLPARVSDKIRVTLLPESLSGAYYLVQNDQTQTLVHLVDGTYQAINVGSSLPTTFFARRGTHFVSISRGSQNIHEVRVDARLVASSQTTKISAATSPNGSHVAFTEIEPTQGSTTPKIPAVITSRVVLASANATSTKVIGSGFAPFFVSDTTLAWFSSDGLMAYDLMTGKTRTLSADVRARAPLSPLPAVSTDGTRIAWIGDSDRTTVHVYAVTDTEAHEVSTHGQIPGATLSLDGETLYVLEQTKQGTQVWQYDVGTRSIVQGIPTAGHVMSLIP